MSAFESKIAEIMQNTKIPGLAMAIVREGSISYVNAMGSRDFYLQEPVDHATLFGIGSVSKSFTAFAILQLYEKGELDINDPISKYLPIRQDGESITIKHLMTMSSGIPDLGILSIQLDIFSKRTEDIPVLPVASEDDLLRYINDGLKEGTRPGERFFYFNSGYTLLGFIVEKVTNISFEDYMRENIFKPLHMDRTNYSSESFYVDENHSKGYITDEKDGIDVLREEKPVFHRFFSAPSGILSCVQDLANYLVMHMRGGKFEGNRLIQSETLELAHRVQFESESIGVPTIDHGSGGYGFGWMIRQNLLGHKYISHGGSVGVYSAHIGFFPEVDVGLILLGNRDFIPPEITMRLACYALGKPVKSFTGLTKNYYLKALCGEYQTFNKTRYATINQKGGVLQLIVPKFDVDLILVPINRHDVFPEKFICYNEFGGTINVEFRTKDQDSSKKISFFFERSHFHQL